MEAVLFYQKEDAEIFIPASSSIFQLCYSVLQAAELRGREL